MDKCLVLLLTFATAAAAQTYTISTVAGGSDGLVLQVPATTLSTPSPNRVAADSSGNTYISLPLQNQVVVVNTFGTVVQIIGTGVAGFAGDGGPAASAQLNGPDGLAVDASGDLFIADGDNGRVRKVSGGVITTVAGNGTLGYNGDNVPATSAELNQPVAVAVDPGGNLLIADYGSNRIRKVSGGIITTVAGNGTSRLI